MPCELHSWLFDAACPACEVERIAQDAAAAVTTAVMCGGDLNIPEFLQRNPDNTMRFPNVDIPYPVLVGNPCAPEFTAPFRNLESTLAERQELYRAAYEADKRKRAQERIAKLKNQRTEKQTWELTSKKRSRT